MKLDFLISHILLMLYKIVTMVHNLVDHARIRFHIGDMPLEVVQDMVLLLQMTSYVEYGSWMHLDLCCTPDPILHSHATTCMDILHLRYHI